jgi:ribulose-5-phosphate 4-epimerase/fuculose-1-phosphate aldolase
VNRLNYPTLREEVCETTRMLCENHLIRLSAGNISMRADSHSFAITPAGLRYDRMRPEDIPILDLDGNILEGERQPSSETPMHSAILRAFPEVGGIVHTHSVNAIAFATTSTELPVICMELLSVGGPVPVAPYACPGSAEAGAVAVEAFKSRPNLKCLMLRNHGLLAIGRTLYDAYENAYKFETGAEVYFKAIQIGTPVPLTAAQIAEVYRVYRKPGGNERPYKNVSSA